MKMFSTSSIHPSIHLEPLLNNSGYPSLFSFNFAEMFRKGTSGFFSGVEQVREVIFEEFEKDEEMVDELTNCFQASIWVQYLLVGLHVGEGRGRKSGYRRWQKDISVFFPGPRCLMKLCIAAAAGVLDSIKWTRNIYPATYWYPSRFIVEKMCIPRTATRIPVPCQY